MILIMDSSREEGPILMSLEMDAASVMVGLRDGMGRVF